MSQDDDTEPGQLRPPRVPDFAGPDSDPPPTRRDTPLAQSGPPPGAFADLHEATKAVVKASERIANYHTELFEPGGVMAKFNANLELLIGEVKGIRGDLQSVGERLSLLERRYDARFADVEGEVGALKQTLTEQGVRIGLLERKAGIDGGPAGT